MFDYPIPPLRPGLYGELGLSPEATPEEINEAKQELSNRIKMEQKAIKVKLDEVYRSLPELRTIRASVEAFEQSDEGADSKEYREAHNKLAALEAKAVQIRADYVSLREQAAIVEQRLHRVNLLEIKNPEDRQAYDRANPPFELIKLADCGASPLDERKAVLAMVREELSSFFEQAGEPVFHPSDLTRKDFTHDYTNDPNLDRVS